MKVLFVATVMLHFKAFHLPYMKWFQDKGWEVHVAANGDLNLPYYDKKHILPIERSPYSVKNIGAYKQLKELLKREKYDIIHCHTPMGSVLSRLANNATKSETGTKLIYTAHGFHFYKGGPFKDWVLYYPVERFLARYTDRLITINKEDYNLAQKFNAKKVEYIPGIGLDTEVFNHINIDIYSKRLEIGVPNDAIMLLSVGELGSRKNHEVAIRALAKAEHKNLYYVICGSGDLEQYLKNLSKELGVSDKILFLGFRKDIAELIKCADIYVFPSQREGLGIAALEGMAGGLPLISSYINGIRDYTVNGETGFCLEPYDVDGFSKAMDKLAKDKDLREIIGKNNVEVASKFDTRNVKKIMARIYTEVMETA
ncbi:glycosyltransferase family 4 protein [Cytobacillus sp. NCCP-133]|uniref:glycosyltransferase family 4 protein n=1 Tax=Cytobacillus sp. NCCP-133 TaxID=766848 RepID=UPI00222EB4C9|nr:glycosyltransferase family 4 protein [Cytobacillus sp. NCCP-133]GLB58984.1 putative glycosyltransferase EpsD [Cytobacillus sp. NCCP-133]